MDILNILNTIRDNASDIYRERIPEATRNNIETIQEAMTDRENAVVTNEFMSTLLNMIIKQVIIAKNFSNPLKSLKKGKKPLGDTIEEIYNNFIKANVYDQTGANLLQRNLPDTKTVFHRMNRQDTYPVTVSPEALFKAFSSYDKLQSYIGDIINQLYNSSELDEFVLMKELIKQALDNNAMKIVNVPDPLTSEANGKAFIKTVKTVSGDMVFPNSNNNAYLTAQDKDDKPIITLSRKNEQILIIDNATEVSVNVDVLASLFNMSVAEFNDTRKITIDAFPDPDIRACLVDEQFFQVYDDLVMFKEWENPLGLYKNYYLHIWQTLAYSILVNSVAFKVTTDSDSDGKLEEFTVTQTLPKGVKSSYKRKSVSEGSTFKTKLTGLENYHVVTVKHGASDVTSTAYDEDTGEIEVATVTNNITVTVEALNVYSVTYNLKEGVTASNTQPEAYEGDFYTTTLTGVGNDDTVTIIMGGEIITSDALLGSEIAIENVDGDIIIIVE